MVKRLDEDFDWRAGPLLEALRRLMAVIEARFQPLEEKQADFDNAINDLTNLGVARMNEVLLPVLQDFIELADTGFLVADSTYSVLLEVGEFKTFVLDEGAMRRQFRPTQFLILLNKDNFDDWAVAEQSSYDAEVGELIVKILVLGDSTNPGPHENWQISGSAGSTMAQMQYYEQGVAQAAQVAADRAAADLAKTQAQAAATEADDARDEVMTTLANLETSGAVISVNGRGGLVTLTKADVGLSNVDNTSDANKPKPLVLNQVDNTSDINKPISTAVQAQLNLKLGTTNKATGSDLRAGTDDTKYLTPKAAQDALAPVPLADAATITAPDMAAGMYFTVTIAAAGRTLPNPTNIRVGRTFFLKVKQDTVGSRTITTYGSVYDFGQSLAPVFSTLPNTEDLMSFFAASATKIVFLGMRKGIE